jgi:arginine N-succinyltransferase
VNAPTYVMRAAGPQDLEAFKELRDIAGPGFTSLMLDDKAFAERLELSQNSFLKNTNAPGSERYFLVLEHIESGTLAGCCGVKATIGQVPPFFNFRLIYEAQSSALLQQRFDMGVLIGVNDFTGCTEVGTLFVRPEHRAAGIGRAVAQSRYMLMATARERFNSLVVSELRGVVSADGVSPFWEAFGRIFFRMDFAEADKLSATTDNQFILDLMPRHPIYIDMLPKSARDVIGKCHKDGEGAQRLLEWEGFAFSNVVDIFDGGPLLTAPRDHIRTLREARLVQLEAAPNLSESRRALIAVPRIADFRCVPARANVVNGVAQVDPAVLTALRLGAGDSALVWVGDAD